MDRSRIPDLEAEVLQGIRKIFTGICFFESGSLIEFDGKALVIGSERIRLQLRPLRLGDVLTISASGSLAKNFRETRAGWFNIEGITTHIYRVVQIDQKTRQAALQKAQLLQSARNAIERVGKLPAGGKLEPSADLPGTLDLTLTGLPEATVRHLLGALEALKPSEASAGLWEHLAEDG